MTLKSYLPDRLDPDGSLTLDVDDPTVSYELFTKRVAYKANANFKADREISELWNQQPRGHSKGNSRYGAGQGHENRPTDSVLLTVTRACKNTVVMAQ